MKEQPNIVLIIADQWATQIANGSGENKQGVQTPALDRLAAEGIRFENSYASFPLCCPNRASLFTGMMPHNHNIIDNEEIYHANHKNYPTRDLITMGASFKAAGYKTAYFGKEHAANYGWEGINEFGSMTYSAGGMLAEGSVYDQVFTRDAVQFLRQEHEQPFYMVLSLINPHDICKVLGGKVKGATIADAIFFCRTDEELYLRSQKRPDLPFNHSVPAIQGMYPYKNYMYEELHDWDEDQWKRYLATYGLLMEKTDWHIESILEELDRSKLAENTIVVFVTDHGEMVSSHSLISKNIFYEESAKTLTIVKQPNQIRPGTVNTEALINTTDLMPTMLDLCNLSIPGTLDGQSFKKLCYGESQASFQELFSVNSDGRMLRFDHYKYIRSELYNTTFDILFDLKADPYEASNIFNAKGYERVSKKAKKRMDEWLKQENLKVSFDSILEPQSNSLIGET